MANGIIGIPFVFWYCYQLSWGKAPVTFRRGRRAQPTSRVVRTGRSTSTAIPWRCRRRVERRKRRETARKAGRGRGARRRVTRAIPRAAGSMSWTQNGTHDNPTQQSHVVGANGHHDNPGGRNGGRPRRATRETPGDRKSFRRLGLFFRSQNCPGARLRPDAEFRSRDDGEEGEIPRPSFRKRVVYAFRNSATLFAASRPEFTWLPNA